MPETTQTLQIDVGQGIHAVLQREKKRFPLHRNRISQMGDPCLRFLYYARHDWDKAKETDDGLQGVFETGKVLESVIDNIASEVGLNSDPPWRIVGTHIATNDKMLNGYEISGTIDGFIQIRSNEVEGRTSQTIGRQVWTTRGVMDRKTMSGNIYPRINSLEDLKRYPWTKKYKAQLMLYALAHDLEDCFILAVNKNNLYQMKLIHFPVDLGYCEELLQRANTVNLALLEEIPPEGINDGNQCPKCDFFAHCCPDISTGGNLKIIINDELEGILCLMEELEEAAEEYKELDKTLVKMLTKGQDVVCGNYLVTWKMTTREYSEQPAKAARATESWSKTIIRNQDKAK